MIPSVNVLNNLFRPSAGWFTRAERGQLDPRHVTRPTGDLSEQLDAAEGIVTLHGACATLVRTPDHVVRSMNVLVPLADFPLPPASLVDLAERIASEHGLIARATVDERFLRVRLARSDAATGEAPELPRHVPTRRE